MKIDIFYKSYALDFELLYKSLQSVKKYATNYNEIHIVIPEQEKHLFDFNKIIGRTTVHFVREYGKNKGYLYQQWEKMRAHTYCSAEFILFMDSDCFFWTPTDVLSMTNNSKPEILYTSYATVGEAICWKQPTERFMNMPIEFEFMHRLPLVYHRSTIETIYHLCPFLEDFIMQSERFSEFNAIGAWAFTHEKDKYKFTNTDKWEFVECPCKQFWSWDRDKKELNDTINAILYDNKTPNIKITNEGFAIVPNDSHIGKWVIEHKRLDFDQNALPQMLPHIKKGGTALDIGANIGCYAVAFAQKANNVICFEPNPIAFDCLEYNLKDNPKIQLHKDAISDRAYRYRVYIENDNVGMAFIAEYSHPGHKRVSETGLAYDIIGSTKTVDSLKLKELDFIKIDVEGYELHVLRGGEKTINKYNPVMVIEINDHTLKRTGVERQEIFDWLTSHNYTFRNIYAEQGLTDDQLDIICFPS